VIVLAPEYMLLYGTANPEGFGGESYEGLYLTATDIERITPQMVNIPVKVEHTVRNNQTPPPYINGFNWY
jgi:hypothetical protein